jgi:LPS sulfotransferase NodH
MGKDTTFVFILGAPRSGTTWLQAMLGAHPQVGTTVELTLYSRYTARWIESWTMEAQNIRDGRWYQGLPFLWGEEEFYGFLREFVERVYQRVLDNHPQATHVVDKHPGYSMYVEDILRIVPEARFIHVIRDGRDVAVSMVAARKRSGFGAGTIQDAAEVWKRHVLAARSASQYRERYMEVRYEDMLADGIGTLEAVFDFCGLPADEDDVAAIVNEHQFERMKAKRQVADERAKASVGHYRKGEAGGWRDELNPVQRSIFQRVAGDLLREIGYAEENWWETSKGGRLVWSGLASMLMFGRQVRLRIFRAAAELLGPDLIRQIRAARSSQRRG